MCRKPGSKDNNFRHFRDLRGFFFFFFFFFLSPPESPKSWETRNNISILLVTMNRTRSTAKNMTAPIACCCVTNHVIHVHQLIPNFSLFHTVYFAGCTDWVHRRDGLSRLIMPIKAPVSPIRHDVQHRRTEHRSRLSAAILRTLDLGRTLHACS
jgi:hypothetical protein